MTIFKKKEKKPDNIYSCVDTIRYPKSDADLAAVPGRIAAIIEKDPGMANETLQYEARGTPLGYAVQHNPGPEVIGLLVNAGAVIKGTKALHYALEYGDIASALLLLEAGADINEVVVKEKDHDQGRTPLISAIRGGNIDAFNFALEHGADFRKPSVTRSYSQRDQQWYLYVENYPLSWAVRVNNVEAVRRLLKLDPESQRKNAIQRAVECGSLEVCRMLMDDVSDTDLGKTEGDFSRTPSSGGGSTWSMGLGACGESNSLVCKAAFSGNASALAYLLSRDITPVPRLNREYSPEVGHVLCRYLESRGRMKSEFKNMVDELLK